MSLTLLNSSALTKLRAAWQKVNAVVWQLNGIPNYEGYLEHFREHHPDQTPLTKEEFFRAMQDKKGKEARCC